MEHRMPWGVTTSAFKQDLYGKIVDSARKSPKQESYLLKVQKEIAHEENKKGLKLFLLSDSGK